MKGAILGYVILMTLESKLFQRYGLKMFVGTRLLETGRLLLEVLKLPGMKNASIESLITPIMFRTAVSAVKAVAGYDPQNMTYTCPSTAIKLSYALQKCSHIVKGQDSMPNDFPNKCTNP